jgi:glycosyltransferase involved in cell wall biosynthesis
MISVIVCTYNPNPIYLERTIFGIYNQNFKDFELIIIDNNSHEPVSDFKYLLDYPSIKVFKELKQGLTAARWAGAKLAKGDILVYVDDDNILNFNYLSVANKTMHENPQIGMLSGQIFPEYEEAPPGWFTKYEGMLALRSFSSGMSLVLTDFPIFNNDFPIGAGMITRRRIIEDYYKNHLNDDSNYIEGRKGNELSSSEDLDYGFYNLSKGYLIGRNSELIITHIIPKLRLKMDYLIKLSTSALKSSYFVNLKWKKIFQVDVLPIFKKSRLELMIRVLFYKLSMKENAILNKKYYSELYKLKYKS